VELRTHAKLTAGALGGVLAITSAAAGFIAHLSSPGSLVSTTGLSLLFVLVAGAIVLARPTLVEALVVADALVALSVIIEMFSRLGVLYLPSLLLFVFATMRSEDLPERAERPARAPMQPMIASQWDRMRAQREASAPEVIGEVPAASAETLRRAG
jgi:hypothetical protein